jgi:uncharacterized protein (DUF433 family)
MDVRVNPETERKLAALTAQTGRDPETLVADAVAGYEGRSRAALDWSQCPVVESIPGKVSGAWVFKDTRTPVSVVFENLEDGLTIDEVIEQFPVTREQIKTVLEFAARSLDAPSPR